MGLGVLESKTLDHVPGTTRYYDDPNRPQLATGPDHGLKVDSSGPVPIILIPQPSDDPNDPLNWPLWKRDLITCTLSMTAIFATALGPILAANTVTLTDVFSTTFTHVAVLTGYFLLGVGVAAIFFVPSARVWGKRHLFVGAAVLLVVSSAWGGAVGSNYESFIAARVFQGVACSPYETLVNVAVGDLYPVHQRGLRMAFTNLAVFGGAFFTPILVGVITHALGWEWTFYFAAIFCAIMFFAVFFLCPETAYRRDMALNTDMVADPNEVRAGTRHQVDQFLSDTDGPSAPQPAASSDDTAKGPSRDPEKAALAPQENPSSSNGRLSPPLRGADTPKKTFIQSLYLFDGSKTDDNYWDLLLRPFPMLSHPAFFWGCLIQGTMIGWTVFIGVTIAAAFLGPPHFWGEVEAGYTYTGPFIGALAGFGIAGVFSDWSVRYMTRLNKGIYEPEFRILMVLPMFVIGGIGLYGFALTAPGLLSGRTHYALPLTFFGFEVAGMVIGAVASSLYIVDAYRDLAIEGFTCMIIFKNFLSFGLTWGAFDWFIQNGIRSIMITIATVQVVVCATSIPMYIYGKRIRAFYHQHDLLKYTKLFGAKMNHLQAPLKARIAQLFSSK